MASKYTYPSQDLRWFIEGSSLALVTMDLIDTSLAVNSRYNPIDESQANGLLLYYNGGIAKIDVSRKDVEKTEPSINKRLHKDLISYILSQLYQNKANVNEADLALSNRHYMVWKRRLAITNGGKLDYEGARIPIPIRITALR